ncbi:MAG: hypothetical protein ACK56F_22990, partial [bacterium]
TCDGLDIIANNLLTPEMKVGDWIVLGGMGNLFTLKEHTLSVQQASSTGWSLFLRFLFGTKILKFQINNKFYTNKTN